MLLEMPLGLSIAALWSLQLTHEGVPRDDSAQ